MVSKTSSYHDALVGSLADPNEARLYLNAVLEDYPEGFLKALRNVAQARQMTKVAEQAGIKRESLYRALSDEGNPTLDTFRSILAALGLRMKIATPDEDEFLAPPPLNPDHEKIAILGMGQRAPRSDSRERTKQNMVDITNWSGLNSSGQKKMNEMEESANGFKQQEALCG